MSYPFGETVTVRSRTLAGQDSDGNDIWTDTLTDVPGCPVWALTAAELTQARDTSIVGLKVLLPPGQPIRLTDQVTVRGWVYEVDGEPMAWRSPITGSDVGVEVSLRRATG